MNEPLVVPGEIDLEAAPAADVPVVEAPAKPVVEETPVEAAPVEEVPVVEEVAEKPKKPGLVAELVEERKERKRLADELTALRQEMHTRLAPPGPTPAELERERAELEATAQELRLYTQPDAEGRQFLDLDAAKRVTGVVTKAARAAAAEAIRPVQRLTMEERAGAHIQGAMAHAKSLGMDDAVIEIMRNQYLEVAKQANGAELLANPDVIKTIWRQGLGAAVEAGVLKPAATAPVGPTAVVARPGAIPAPAAGRRSPQVAIQLSPAAQRVYKDAGLDPTKQGTYATDKNGAISLED